MSLMKDTMTLYMSLLFNFAIHGNLACSSGLIALPIDSYEYCLLLSHDVRC